MLAARTTVARPLVAIHLLPIHPAGIGNCVTTEQFASVHREPPEREATQQLNIIITRAGCRQQ